MEVWLVLTACITLAFFANPGQCCGPAEIGQKYTITSTAKVSIETKVLWQANGNNLYKSDDKNNSNKYPLRYDATSTKLTILSVTKYDGTSAFNHNVNGVIVYTCKLLVYKRASTPKCENVSLTGNQIRSNCTTDEVYPEAKCQYILQNERTDRIDISNETSHIAYNHTYPPNRNDSYSTSCTLQYPVNALKPGNWEVQVNMYPNLTGVSLSHGTIGQAANTLQLTVPTVSISTNSTNCPKGLDGEGDNNVKNGYIRQGERGSCLCVRAHAGNPPGAVRWSSTQGGNFAILSNSSVDATIQINANDTFTCQSTSVLDGSPDYMAYTPSYAYGPNSSSLNFQPTGRIYLCLGQQTNINITCQVPANSFSPATLFTIRDNNGNNLVTKVAGDNAWSKSVNYNFTKSGQHTFTCRVENAIFSDIFSEAAASAEVYEPPREPPKITAWAAGDDVIVTCLALAKIQSEQSITLTCGEEQTVTTNVTSAELTLNTTGLRYNETNCTCQATHVTGCYNLTSDAPLTVLMNNANQSEQDFPIGAAVGGAIGAVLVIAVVVGVILIIRRRRKNKDQHRHRADAGGYPPPQEPIEPYDPNTDPEAVIVRNDVYVGAKDYKQIQPTITTAMAFPKIYRPDNKDNPYEDVNPEELKRESLVTDTMDEPGPGAKPVPAPKPNPAAEPNVPQTSVKTKSAAEPSVQAEVNEVYATVNKARLQHSKKPSSDQSDDRTKILAAGESPELPKRLYNTEDLRDSVNESPRDKEVDHTYSNEAFDHEGDENTYVNIGKT